MFDKNKKVWNIGETIIEDLSSHKKGEHARRDLRCGGKFFISVEKELSVARPTLQRLKPEMGAHRIGTALGKT